MHFPEINLLVSTLAKCGSLELFTSAYNNTILPLIPHKDRSIAVDRTTTLIRKTYGVRATTLWCYGQIWASSIVAMMKTIGLERLVISSYDALGQKTSGRASFRMNEIGRKIDVLQANYFTDDEIFIQEVALYKLSTPVVLENPGVSSAVRHHGAQIVEVNPTYTVVSKRGMTEDIMSLYYALNDFNCVLQYVRSGRIAITKSCTEYLDEFLEERRKSYEALQKK